jgi:hypothetical protein
MQQRGHGSGAPLQAADAGADSSHTACGHRVDADAVNLGFNTVVDSTGAAQLAQGKPLQGGWTLVESTSEISAHNDRKYARIASFMMPIRDALMCDIATVDEADWRSLTQVLTLNDIKMEQDLSGTPPRARLLHRGHLRPAQGRRGLSPNDEVSRGGGARVEVHRLPGF